MPYAAYGPDAVTGQSALNRPAFVNALVTDWLPHLPDVLARLEDPARPARVADLGCGAGWAAIELAKAFPHIRVDGRDNDEASIALGRNAVDHGVADRVNLEVVDLADGTADWSPRYDLVLFVECLHDFPRPVEALRHARSAVRPGGTVLVVDLRAAETFTAPGTRSSGSSPRPAPSGACRRAASAPTRNPSAPSSAPTPCANWPTGRIRRRDIVPIEHPFWRFYRLTP